VGRYIWSSEEGTGGPPGPLIAVPNVTARPSAASVQVTVLLYDGPLLCGINVFVRGLMRVACKGWKDQLLWNGLSDRRTTKHLFTNWRTRMRSCLVSHARYVTSMRTALRLSVESCHRGTVETEPLAEDDALDHGNMVDVRPPTSTSVPLLRSQWSPPRQRPACHRRPQSGVNWQTCGHIAAYYSAALCSTSVWWYAI